MARVSESPCFLKISCLLLHLPMPRAARDVLARLHWHRNGRTGQCNPRIATMAEELGMNERSTKYAISWLRRFGFLSGHTRGRYRDSYLLAPEEQWTDLAESAKGALLKGGSRVQKVHSLSAKGALSKVQKVHLADSASLYEAEKKKQNMKQGEERNTTFSSTTTRGESPNGAAPPSPALASANGQRKANEQRPSAQVLSPRDAERERYFEALLQVFDGCGRPVPAGAVKQARKEFFRYPREEQEAIATDACIRALELWNEPRWTPEWHVYLRSRDWRDRPVKERTLPRKTPVSAQEEILRQNYERACQRDREERRR